MNAERELRGCTDSLTLMIRPAVVAQERAAASAQRGRRAHISRQTRVAVAEATAMHSNEQSERVHSVNPI